MAASTSSAVGGRAMPGIPSFREAIRPGSQQGISPRRPMAATALRWMVLPQMTALPRLRAM